MTGIAGIYHSEGHEEVKLMLDEIAHRGKAGRAILEFDNATFGVVWTNSKEPPILDVTKLQAVQDCAGEGQFARAQTTGDGLTLMRDQTGVAPLYYGHTRDGEKLCFASEVKALLKVSSEVQELLPGHRLEGSRLQSYFQL
jgi:asparagine synthetase B (glutamine-hydrolysing)